MMEELVNKLKSQIIEQLSLEEITPDDFDKNTPLFGEGLGLDSIDALELIVLLEREYGIKLNDPQKGKEVFRTVDTMAKYIMENKK
jgi:acyl carrier protein